MIIVPLCGSVRDGRHIYFGTHTPQDTQDAELINEAADGLSLMNFLLQVLNYSAQMTETW